MLRVVCSKAPSKYQLITYHSTSCQGYRTIRIVTANHKISCTDRLLAELRATACYQEFMVCNFTFDARNSQPASLLSRALTWYRGNTYIVWHTRFTAYRRKEGFFAVSFLLTVDDKLSVFICSNLLLAGLRATTCEQEFCFGVSRFMREIP